MMTQKKLVSASVLEMEVGLPKSTSYRLAKRALIPSYKVGPKMTGVRFIVAEVLEALRTPACKEKDNG